MAGAWVVYDFQTMHGTRKHSGWEPSASATRLLNIILPRSSRTLTLAELREHSGKSRSDEEGTKRSVLFAARGVVYDVSDAASFNRGGSYQAFAGHDGTYALAKMSLDRRCIHANDISTLTDAERESLNDWVSPTVW